MESPGSEDRAHRTPVTSATLPPQRPFAVPVLRGAAPQRLLTARFTRFPAGDSSSVCHSFDELSDV